jgi:plastocyanin
MSPTSGPTNADGVASSTWSLGTTSGAQTAQATVAGAVGSPVTFTGTAVAGSAATLAKLPAGDNQAAETGTQLALPVQALVTDEHANGVAGVAVGWEATGGTVSSSTVPTVESGISSVTVTAGGTAGPIIITAAADGLDGSPLTFNATAVAPAPIPPTASITVGNTFFRSNRNASVNPAVDTVQTGGTVTWTWTADAIVHNVDSDGTPSFTDSPLQTGPSYSFTFSTAGAYQYTCAVHPGQMTGRIVVR